VGETERLPREAYQADVSEKIYAVLNEKAGRIVRAGHSVIVDAVFAKKTERDAIEAAARNAEVRFHGFYLTADLGTRLKRIGGRGPDASDADAAVARQQEAFALGEMAWTVIDASGPSTETLAKVRDRLN
jgi:predicted kinase